APFARAVVDRLAHRSSHRKDARIAAGDECHLDAVRGAHQGGGGSRQLLAIVGGVAYLASDRIDPGEIRLVAEQFARRPNGSARLRRDLRGIARAEPDHEQLPRHGRASHPGTSTSAKYGASSSVLSASGSETAFAIVPRST